MKLRACFVIAGFLSAVVCTTLAQTAAPTSSVDSTQVPRLIKFSGVAKDESGKLMTGAVGITFSLYKDQQGGSPLWVETQNVQADAAGHYTAMLGSASADGVPLEVFSSGEAQWLGVQIQGQPAQARVLLVSVPYAFKAHEAETLSGRSISDFVLLNKSGPASASASSAPTGPNGTVSSNPPSASNGPTNFVGNNATQIVGVTQKGAGAGLSATAITHAAVVGTITGKSNTAVYGLASNTSKGSSAAGVTGQTNTDTGPGVAGYTSSPNGTGVLGVANSSAGGSGVVGIANATTNQAFGVSGSTSATAQYAAGVTGSEGATTGTVFGVSGNTSSTTAFAAGVSGYEGAVTGKVYGVTGGTSSTTAVAAGVFGFENAAAADDVYGVYGYTGSTGSSAAGVAGYAGGTTGQVYGVTGGTNSTAGTGVAGFANAGSGTTSGVYGQTNGNGTGSAGVNGNATANSGVTNGVFGQSASTNGIGVSGNATATAGNAYGVSGTTATTGFGAGVAGNAIATTGTAFGGFFQTASTGGVGLFGYASAPSGTSSAVTGQIESPKGIAGYFVAHAGSGLILLGTSGSNNADVFSVDASGNGFYAGNLNVTGKLTKGSGSFKIDHPMDPANKYLSHSFVESPDMMNVYNGNVMTDRHGLATVTLPDYFEALNGDFRYQLTVIGQFAQAIVAKKIAGNAFVIRTSRPHVEVSWQVTGIRHDAYANQYRIPVEEEKAAGEQGYYLHPEVFGQPESKGISAARKALPASQDVVAEAAHN